LRFVDRDTKHFGNGRRYSQHVTDSEPPPQFFLSKTPLAGSRIYHYNVIMEHTSGRAFKREGFLETYLAKKSVIFLSEIGEKLNS